ncbi:single-stranded DNA-binding protein [Thalassotalea agarivorans]|uniref:Plasmid-derived single-stranded DNA-binding protein n=1 Tax=Thalassotalea agarivorans TaxID=349064 RepID=A0A1I0E3V5_THASX|nr:single-stranded DNA-binding protein [Thalassotalea agarivorans]SET39316.1 Single-strand binding protein family protein [Thalassotalea agarivorans]
MDYTDLCTVTLLGNLVAKPEIRYQANPVVAVAEVRIATHKKWYDKQSQQFKEWTSFHTVKVIGEIVEDSLRFANKGDVILVQGYLLNSKQSNRQILHAAYAQCFAKGYAQSMNQVQSSGTICSPIKLMTTEQDKTLAEFSVCIKHAVVSPVNKELKHFDVTRLVHVWGKQAEYISTQAQEGEKVVIDGKLSYLNDDNKTQFIECRQIDLIKSS